MTEKGSVTDTEIIESDPVETPIEQVESAEEMIPKSHAERLIKKAKLKGRDQMQDQLDALRAENESLKQNSGGQMGGMAAPVNVEEIEQRVLANLRRNFQEASEARAQEELQKQAQDIASAYKVKMDAGKTSYQDFDSVMADFNPAAFPNLVFLANQMDNTHDVMYELMTNPNKLATVIVMSERDPQAAQNMLARISSSIKANQAAKASEKDVQPPLGRLSSSTQTTGQNSGDAGLSMNDLKRMFKG